MSESGFASTQEAHRQADLHYLDNRIDIALYLSCTDEQPPSFDHAQCQFLPFLRDDKGVRRELQVQLNEQLAKHDVADWQHPEEMCEALRQATATVLAKHCGIQLSPRLTIELQLCGENALKGHTVPQAEWLRLVPYERYLVDNCKKLQPNKLSLVYARLVFTPISEKAALGLELHTAIDFRISRIAIVADEHELAAHEVLLTIKNPKGRLRLPAVAVRHYQRLREAKSLALKLTLADQTELVLPLDPKRVETADLREAPYAYFIDLGSTFYKAIRIELNGSRIAQLDGHDAMMDAKVLRGLVQDALAERSQASRVSGLGPTETSRFIRELGIPEFRKEELASAGSAAQARWIANAIHCLAAYWAKQRRALAYVVWSFPDIDGKLQLDELTAQINALTRDVVLCGVTVLSEHEALRHRFQGVLGFMASEATKRKQAIDSAQSTNADKAQKRRAADAQYQKQQKAYSKLWFFQKWFAAKPVEPDARDHALVEVPSLEQWHAEFLSIAADPELKDVLIFDAGGYSLDVYCQVDGRPYGKSFAAGGSDLTERVRGFMAKEKGLPSERVTQHDADIKKRAYCDPSTDGEKQSELAQALARWTREIYTEPLQEVLRWVHAQDKKAGLPMLLTGGAMENFHLRQLVHELFTKSQVSFVPTSSITLTECIAKNRLATKPELALFERTARGFGHDKAMLKIAFDISGGLLSAKLKEDV